jgi:tetratricopeptide (TPR) repeat protein
MFFRIIMTALLMAIALPVLAGTAVDDAGKLLAGGDFDGALELLEGAPAEEQATSPYHTLLGQAYLAKLQTVSFMEKGPLARQALEHLQKAIEIDPTNVEARATLGSYYLNAPPIAGGSTDLALEQAQEIVKYDPVQGNFIMAQIHMKGEQYGEATAAFEKVLESEPGNRGALYQIGKISALSGENLDRGKECLEEYLGLDAVEGFPGHDGAHWRMGMVLEHEGDLAGARAEYEKAIAMDPENEQFTASLEALDAE